MYQTALLQNNLSATPSITTWGTQLTAHATPHSKGAWATLMTTTYDVYGFWIYPANTSASGTQTDMMYDIAIGAAQENIIVSERFCGYLAGTHLTVTGHYYPIFIPRGTLVSARIQALISVDTVDVVMFANAGTSGQRREDFFSGCEPIGTVPASTGGTAHTPGDTGTESTAANIGSPTSRAYGAIALGFEGNATLAVAGNTAYHWELVIGSTSICEWWTCTNGSEYFQGPIPPTPFHCSIPAGTQLLVMAEASATAQAHGIAFYGFF